jgi:hypothetical protein
MHLTSVYSCFISPCLIWLCVMNRHHNIFHRSLQEKKAVIAFFPRESSDHSHFRNTRERSYKREIWDQLFRDKDSANLLSFDAMTTIAPIMEVAFGRRVMIQTIHELGKSRKKEMSQIFRMKLVIVRIVLIISRRFSS